MRRGTPHRRSLPWLSAAAILSLASLGVFVGCGGGIGGFCEAAAECELGNDADIAACETDLDETVQLAELSNCEAEFDEWFACLEDNARCNDDRFRVNDGQCGDEEDRLDDCID